MVRTGFVLILNMLLVVNICTLDNSTISKRSQKCLAYNEQVYGQRQINDLPSCATSTNTKQPITIQEFPHIATLGYRSSDGGLEKYRWYCFGTLVSSRYVISVAHCINKPKVPPIKVRLGETSAYLDESKHTDYDVEKILMNEFPLIGDIDSSTEFYIGLIKLSHKVKFSEYVRPICLPDMDLSASSPILYQVNYETFFHQTFEHRSLKKYENRFVTRDECQPYFDFPNHRIVDGLGKSLLCIRKTSPTKYETIGESGAPIYIEHPQVPYSHIQVGIVSYIRGVRYPVVGTKVFDFAEWIESVIWAEGEDM